MFDLLIRNVRVVDGSGRPWRRADVAIQDGRLADIGRLDGRAHRAINGEGRVLAPGFIDMHAHSDLAVFRTPLQEMKVAQGVTTELIAQDGLGCAPVNEGAKARVAGLVAGLLGEASDWNWNSVADYLKAVDGQTAVNVATLAPHATIRADLLDGEDRAATPAEIEGMAGAVEAAMRDGAFGFSTGLEYEPTTAATTEEVAVLAGVSASYDGLYVTHVRDYDTAFLPALGEALEIGQRANSPVHYSHYHCYGRRNFGLGPEICRRADDARVKGVDVSFDIYPYRAGSTHAHFFVSRDPQMRSIARLRGILESPSDRATLIRTIDTEGSPIDIAWDQCYAGAGAELIEAHGKSLQQAADERSLTPGAVLVELIERSNFTATIIGFMLDAGDIDNTLHHPLATIGSDAILHGERPHPRGWGAFAKMIRKYVVGRETMTIEEAVATMAGRPAARLGLTDRGLIMAGFLADLCLFEPTNVRDEATYDEPMLHAQGFDLVVVNGEVVWEEGAPTGATPGRALRSRPGQAAGSRGRRNSGARRA